MRLSPRFKNSIKKFVHPLIKNTNEDFPIIRYGLHMAAGIAEYADGPGGQPYKIFVSSDTAKKMDPSFATCPIFVDHVDDEQPNAKNKTIDGLTQDDKGNPEKVTADGFVIESFYNPADGMHWAKMLITSKEGVDALKRGWKLSNCYQPINLGPGGEWHGTTYSREFTDAEYRHMALVSNPRYRESIVLTPEEFKEYNLSKVSELAALRNSADVQTKSIKIDVKFPEGEKKMSKSIMDMLFGKKSGKLEKVENASEIGKIEVNLGKNRRVSIEELVQKARVMNDDDFTKMMDEEDRPDLTNGEEDEDKENDLEDLKEKNKKKSSVDEDMENDLEDLKEKNEESDRVEEVGKVDKFQKNKKSSADDMDMENDESDDEKMAKLREKQNRKKSSKDGDLDAEMNDGEDMDMENEEFKGRGTKGEKDFVENDDEEKNPLKNVINMDGEDTTVGDMINSFVDLKNKYNTLRSKHNDLKSAHSEMCNKWGDDDAFANDADIPERDEEMQEALGKLENEEKALENSLAKRKNSIEKVISRMKNKAEAIAKREQKAAEGKEHFNRMQNAELEAMLNSASGPVTGTETSSSMVERGKSRYGSQA